MTHTPAESESERMFRNYIMENFLNTGNDMTRVLRTTSDIMEQVSDLIPGLTSAEVCRQLGRLGFPHCISSDEVLCKLGDEVLWELYEHTPPIDRWK